MPYVDLKLDEFPVPLVAFVGADGDDHFDESGWLQVLHVVNCTKSNPLKVYLPILKNYFALQAAQKAASGLMKCPFTHPQFQL